MPLQAVKAAKEAMKTLEEALTPKKQYLFRINLKVGDLIPQAFDPEKELSIVADSTEEFMINLKNEFLNIKENPDKINKEGLRKLERSMANLEMKSIMNFMRAKQLEKESLRIFN